MARRIVRSLGAVTTAAAIAGLSTWALGACWTWIGGGDLSIHGWIAMALGVTGTIAMTWGLMTLAFKSDREGWDDRVDNRRDPGRPIE